MKVEVKHQGNKQFLIITKQTTMENKKIFCGSGRKKNDTWLQITINPDKIKDYIQEFKGSKYVKLNINIGNADKFGKDVQVTIDQFNPKDLSVTGFHTDLPF